MKSITSKIIQFKVGDKYIRISPYGGITTGIITRISYITYHQTVGNENYSYKSWYIINDTGIILEINGDDGEIYKLEEREK
jgi:hypothetical protein